MDPTDITIQILRDIRDEIRGTNTRVDALGERVERLENRQVQTETRLATELIAVAHAVGELRDLLRERLDLRDRVEDHERRIIVLEQHPPHD